MALCPPGIKTTVEWQYPGEAKQRIEGADDYSTTPVHSSPAKYEWKYDMGLAIFAASSYTPQYSYQGCNNTRDPIRRCVDDYITSNRIDTRRNYSGFHAPIYSYRVSDYAESNERCIPNGSQPLSIPCGLAKGYRKVEILCHGDSFNYSPTPVWLLAWDATENLTGNALGGMLQIPNGGTYSVVYEPSTNRYVGVIPGSYGWGYFYFNPLTNALPTGYLFKILKDGTVVYQRSKSDKPVVTHFCGEECPPGTCQCESGDVVCCYDTTTGRAVKSFRK
jgi:hypothetical protein